jgi:hypothetical protein
MRAPTAVPDSTVAVRTVRDSLARAILAGFAASLTMLLLFLVAFNLARLLSAAEIPAWPGLERRSIIHPASWTTEGSPAVLPPGQADAFLETPRLWLTNLTSNRLIDAGLSDVYLAAGVYFAGGLLWAILYAYVEPRLSGAPWLRGVTFAMLPALVSLVVVLPLLGGGLFGMGLGAGPLPIIGNVILHAVYGAMLGIVFGPFGDLDATTLERPIDDEGRPYRTQYEQTAATFLVTGLVVGTLVGVMLSMLSGESAVRLPIGEANSGLILWGALIGAALGLFIGSFVGLSQHPQDSENG